MAFLITQLTGVAVFWVVTVALGVLLRRRPPEAPVEGMTRVSHLAFWLGMIAPWAVGMFVPGPSALDRIVGLPPLALPAWLRLPLGAVLLVAGVVFMQLAITGLGRKGRGAPAFKLTQTVVATGVYAFVRNPMSLGFYVALLGGSLLSGSSWVLLYTVIGVIPAHLFNLKYFEELELRRRYGESYERYRETTPFLVPRLRSRRPARAI